MSESAYEELEAALKTLVWTGFSSRDQVFADALEGLADGVFSEEPVADPDAARITQLVDAEFDRKSSAERSWPAETPCDRLTHTFEALTKKGILAIENAGYSMNDGWGEFDEVVAREWKPVGARPRGGCFYHQQDLERAVAGGGLYLAYSASSGKDADGVPIANEIMATLREHGFQPAWNGKSSSRIHVPIEWRRRYGPPARVAPPSALHSR